MLLRMLYDEKLAQASWLVGCQRTGEAIVIDPARDAERYLAAAGAEGLRIRHVTETHIHADFLSGARELARRATATVYLSGHGGADWSYAWASEPNVRTVRDGDLIEVGNVRLTVLHTPGHTPEHVSFLLTDGATTDQPMGVFTGDFVFVGDVGRPDLLERAASIAGTMEAGARTLYHSLQRFKGLPDYLQVWPGHGAGSACGKALGAVPSSTLGYERFANWGLAAGDEATFVREVLEAQPEPPPYFASMKRLNREGPPPRPSHDPGVLPAERLGPLLGQDALVVDTRSTRAFAAGHVPGTVNVPQGRSFVTYAGWLIPFGAPFYLVLDLDRPGALEQALRDCASIGLDGCAGVFPVTAVRDWPGERGTVPQVTPAELAPRLAARELSVVDVRGASEWAQGHVPGAPNIHYGRIGARAAELPRGPVVLMCETGSRSAIAASVLQARGRRDVVNLAGGLDAWREAGLPVER